MPEPAQTAVSAPRFALGDRQAAYAAAVERARTEDWATRLFARDATLWTDDPRVAETILDRLGWLDAPAHFTERDRRPRGVRRRSRSTRGSRPRSSPAWAAAVSHRTSSTGRSARSRATSRCASSIRPTRPTSPATLDDLDPLRTLVLVASKSGHDDRAERLPGLRLGSRRGGSQGRPASRLRAPRRLLRAHHRPGQERRCHRAPRRRSARSSSTRPTSAAATRR